ncbi:hypothetical protein [Aquimarina sp. 2201CG5-10]|uniref:hypothetical protein n=1 Tax=Aquimarina callyspongiae TaxID=3098150 RepID=UPI002AB506BE|nr:hypothetical protein [Aquimarina sp. 2201CG5-10]MDY8138123.1 hypothetical protein [Aquimarina sp. 2201CG5-10]
MKALKNFNLANVKMLTRQQKVSINGGVTNQEDCEAKSRPGELECNWVNNGCICRVVIRPC